jgi:hypothetical protein
VELLAPDVSVYSRALKYRQEVATRGDDGTVVIESPHPPEDFTLYDWEVDLPAAEWVKVR